MIRAREKAVGAEAEAENSSNREKEIENAHCTIIKLGGPSALKIKKRCDVETETSELLDPYQTARNIVGVATPV